jgi:hypothetical protein
MKSIAVFCASADGSDPIYKETAYEVGKSLGEKGYRIVYGGGKVGSMGAVARGGLEAGAEVIGVIPDFLKTKEVAMEGLTELIVVNNMHERKLQMNELSDGSISLPGGFGTLEEYFEIITWGQLGLHSKPSALLNVNAYYDPMIAQFDNMVESGLLRKKHAEMLLIDSDLDTLIQRMENYQHPVGPRWLDRDEV